MKTSAKHFGPRPGNMSQNDPKTTAFMTSLKKSSPPTKQFFSSADQKTGQSVWATEQLSSAISGEAMALVRQPKTAVFRLKTRYEYNRTPAFTVLTNEKLPRLFAWTKFINFLFWWDWVCSHTKRLNWAVDVAIWWQIFWKLKSIYM